MKETNQFQIFNSPEFGKVRIIVGNDGEPKFSLSDICKILGLVSTKTAQRLGDDVLSKHPIVDRLGRQQIASFINEDGLYDIILDSRKPGAKKFRKWVTSEVLPSIRKNGAYLTEKTIERALNEPDFLIELATNLKKEKQAREFAEERNEVRRILSRGRKKPFVYWKFVSRSLITSCPLRQAFVSLKLQKNTAQRQYNSTSFFTRKRFSIA
ncbi:BRO-N domain-containing protein [Phocaeicola paurosaccharolyticus]|uniref:BRO-N domain-containing protein n=1 Tax=Phocaeicola paurosaccharolyticus TaxID=732242 RepID=UPI0004686119|nr:Bro-N domain-containing protein [Phocaeicola paurosaccharolyticus]